jgi:hypothetical protein
MCDGNKSGTGITLQTQSFTVKENVFIIGIFIHKFNLKCSLHMQRNQPTIYISSKSITKIKPFILPYFSVSTFAFAPLLALGNNGCNSKKQR